MMIVDRYRCRVMDDLVGIVWMTYMTLGTITVVDVVLASSLCYFLATSRAGFSRYSAICLLFEFHVLTWVFSTDSILTKLIVYTINTGCLTRCVPSSPNHTLTHTHISCSVFSIIGMITVRSQSLQCQFVSKGHIQCAATPGNFIFLGFELLIAKCMSNNTWRSRWSMYHFKYMSTRSLRSSMHNTTYSPIKTIPNIVFIPESAARGCITTSWKTEVLRHLGPRCSNILTRK